MNEKRKGNMDLKQLQYFVVSVECGSFKRAAEMLYTTQPHISKTLKSLEEELGCELLARTAKGVEATEVGKNIYNYARQVLIDSNRIINIPEELYEEKLRVAANSGDKMVTFFTHFLLENKGQELHADYVKGSTSQIIESVANRETDLGFCFISHRQKAYYKHMIEQEKLEFGALMQSNPVLCVGPGSPLYNLPKVEDSQLRNFRFIQSQEDDYAISMNPGYMQAESPFYKNQQVITTNSEHLLIHMLLETDLCNISYNLPTDDCVNEQIRAIPISGKGQEVTFGYLMRKQERLPMVAQRFLDFVKEHLHDTEDDFHMSSPQAEENFWKG